jgi:hypothetical protein
MTTKLAISFSVAALALAACGTPGGNHATVVVGPADPVYVAASQPVVIGSNVRTGSGKITLLTDPTGPVADLSAQRVTLRMRDGTLQTVIVRGEQLKFGEDIAIRSDMSIRREPIN